MKKNKKTTYVLLLVVLCLWVVVFYRLYKSFFSEPALAVEGKKKNEIKAAPEADTRFVLQANYQDPFFGKNFSSRIAGSIERIVKRTEKPKEVKKEEVPMDWSFISYIGLIKNQKNQKQVALVSIQGKEYMVSEGETISEVSFLKNTRDSIQISYQGKTTYLRKM